MIIDSYTEGWTAPIKHQLLQDGASFNATTMTPTLVLTDKNGAAVSLSGTVAWTDASTSKVQFNPGSTDLKASLSPYTMHWKVTDGTGKIAFYPQGEPIQLKVYSA